MMTTIVKTLVNAFNALYINRNYLIKALAIPFILICLFKYSNPKDDEILKDLFGSILSGICYCYMAITTHRIIILGHESVPTYGIYKPTNREISFAGHLIGLSVIAAPFFIIASLTPNIPREIVFPILGILFLYFCARVSIVFPAIACDTNWSYTEAWVASKNHKLLVIVTVGIFPMISTRLLLKIGNLFETNVITVVLSTLSTVIIVAALSSTYQYIKDYEIIS